METLHLLMHTSQTLQIFPSEMRKKEKEKIPGMSETGEL